MQRKLVVEFTKMNGAGNDFIVIDNRFYNFSPQELSDLAHRWCPRRTGVGADGVLAFSRPQDRAHHFRMQYYNADGSLGTMCGNGARCLARFAREAGLQAEEYLFETEAGVLRALVPGAEQAPISLWMDPPRDWIPHRRLEGETASQLGDVHSIWTGTEHAVHFVEHVADIPVATWGPAIRHDKALAPTGANVNFVEVHRNPPAGATLSVRTFEKGVEAETLACGTGALASALAARLLGYLDGEVVRVEMPGGTLGVGFRYQDGVIEDLYLEGPTEIVYRGTLEV